MRIKRAAAALGTLVLGSGLALVTVGAPPAHAGPPSGWTFAFLLGPPAQVAEGDSGVTPVTFTLVNPDPGPACNVNLATAALPLSLGGLIAPAAVGGSDYQSFSQTVNLPLHTGASSYSFTVNVLGDTVIEPDELFLVLASSTNLSNPCPIVANIPLPPIFFSTLFGYGPDTAVDAAFIMNDDAGPLQLTMPSDSSLCEASGPATVHLALNRPLVFGESVTFDLGTINGTADSTNQKDFTATSTPVTISYPDSTIDVPLVVPVTDDFIPEPNKYFKVVVSNLVYTGTNSAAVIDSNTIVTIKDDDVVGQAISVSDPTVTEGTGGTTTMTFTISSAKNAICDGLKIPYKIVDGTAQAAEPDYTNNNPNPYVIIPAGSNSATVDIDITTDSNIEPDETLALQIDAAALPGITGDLEGIGTIIDDDFPTVNVDDATSSEGTGGTSYLAFHVTLDCSSSPNPPADCGEKTSTVQYSTSNGTAQAGTDYTSTSGTLTFLPGVTSQTVYVPITTDGTPELDEDLSLNLSALVNLESGDLTGHGIILNDDAWIVNIGNATITPEGNPSTPGADPSVLVTFSLNAPAPPAGICADWTTADGTAVSATDYFTDDGTVCFGPGQSSKTIEVQAKSDEVHEDTESFNVNLDGVSLDGPQDKPFDPIFGQENVLEGTNGTVTIIDDDPEDLPATGADTNLEVLFGLGFLGAGLVLLGNRKRRPTVS